MDFNLKDKAPTLKKISKLLKRRDLFDEERFELFKSVIITEIRNLLSRKECEEIMKEMGDVTMSDESIIMLDRIFSGIDKKNII